MTKTHEQIPLLAKLRVYYFCDKCYMEIFLGKFYDGIGRAIKAASIEDGKLTCPGCRDKRLKGKG